jgi:hypothetical protein
VSPCSVCQPTLSSAHFSCRSPYPTARVELVRLRSAAGVTQPGPASVLLGTRSTPTPPGDGSTRLVPLAHLDQLGITAGDYQLRLYFAGAQSSQAVARRNLVVHDNSTSPTPTPESSSAGGGGAGGDGSSSSGGGGVVTASSSSGGGGTVTASSSTGGSPPLPPDPAESSTGQKSAAAKSAHVAAWSFAASAAALVAAAAALFAA